jgi:hypothetical protein
VCIETFEQRRAEHPCGAGDDDARHPGPGRRRTVTRIGRGGHPDRLAQ